MDYRPITAGIAASWAALSPSLVPRRWWMTGISVAAASSLTALSVRLGVRTVRSVRRSGILTGRRGVSSRSAPARHPRSVQPDVRTRLGLGVLGLAAAGTGVVLARVRASQREVAALTGMREEGELGHALGYLAGGVGWAALEVLVRLVRRLRLRVARTVAAHLPMVPGALVAAAVLVVFLRLEGWFLSRVLSRVDESAVIDSFARLGPGPRPQERERSGSRESGEPFLTLGIHGRAFVTGGPRAARIAEVWERLPRQAAGVREESRAEGRPRAEARPARTEIEPAGVEEGTARTEAGPVHAGAAPARAEEGPERTGPEPVRAAGAAPQGAPSAREPVRVFIGRLGHPDPQAAAAAAVAELERAGAFERKAVLMATGTGSGWVPPWTVSAFEYLMRGDCATVSVQYSFAASWLAFLIHRGPAQQMALEVRRAVRARIDSMPRSRRPRLYATGESLGAYGGLGAFTTPGTMLRRIDGAVWTGTPRTAEIFDHLLAHRRRGSHEVRPVYGTGRHFRFAARPADLSVPPAGFEYGRWLHPRVVFAQHASDPVVWWSPRLIWQKPDWLREPRGEDVSAAVRWSPVITFWQLSADMPRSVRLPGGHGHSYHGEVVHYWNAVLGTEHTAEVCAEIAHAIAVDLAPSAGALPLTDAGARLRRQPARG